MRFTILGALAFIVLAGCGAGSGTRPVPSASPTPANGLAGTARFTLTIPNPAAPTAAHRRPQYVSPSSTAVDIVLQSANGIATKGTVSVPLDGSDCVTGGNGRTCTVTANEPAATDVFGMITYYTDSHNNKIPLSLNPAFTVQVAQDGSTVAPVTLSGIVVTQTASLEFLGSPNVGFPSVAKDAGGNVISGSALYYNGIIFTSSDPGAYPLAQVAVGRAASQTLTDPANLIQIQPATVANGTAIITITIVPAPITIPAYFGSFVSPTLGAPQVFTLYCDFMSACNSSATVTIPVS